MIPSIFLDWDGEHTQVLDVLVAEHLDGMLLHGGSVGTAILLNLGTESLVDDDAVGGSGRDEGQAVRDLGGGGVGVELDE